MKTPLQTVSDYWVDVPVKMADLSSRPDPEKIREITRICREKKQRARIVVTDLYADDVDIGLKMSKVTGWVIEWLHQPLVIATMTREQKEVPNAEDREG